MANRIGQQLGNYRLTHLIGRGGFADVYLGEHVRLGTQTAVKVLHTRLVESDEVERFQREASTIAHLEHPHIVRVLDFDVQEGTPFLIMGNAPHGNLRQRHPKGVSLPLKTIVNYIKQVADALQYAHEHKVIHRDIKPENMLIGLHHEILLGDFGIALLAQSSRLQNTQEVAGTAYYMAPEQLQGKPRLASDQYALGIVVYEWLCGHRPFEGSFTEIASQHMFTPPPSLSEKVSTILPEVEYVVLTTLEKDPHKRFGSVQAFATALEQACQVTSSSPVTPPLQVMPLSDPALTTNEGVAISLSQPPISTNVLTPLSQSSLLIEAVTGEQSSQALPAITQAESQASSPPPLAPTASQGQKQPRRFPAGIKLLLFILVVLLVGGSGLLYYTTVYQQNVRYAQATATTVAQAKVTVTAVENPYTHSGALTLSDPLSDNSQGHNWAHDPINCGFSGGTYHVKAPNPNHYDDCPENSIDYSNFAFEVQMQFIKGDTGGIIFRYHYTPTHLYFYTFLISQDMNYSLSLVNGSSTNPLANGKNLAIKQGLNQINLIAVIAQGNTIKAYVNHQQIASVTDSTFSTGKIGIMANPISNPTEVIFSNAKVWTL